jgi:hypothetical protein
MTKDDIIRMAKEAGDVETDNHLRDTFIFDDYGVERFANLVAAAEQKRCVGIIHGQCGSDNVAQRTVNAIRSQS